MESQVKKVHSAIRFAHLHSMYLPLAMPLPLFLVRSEAGRRVVEGYLPVEAIGSSPAMMIMALEVALALAAMALAGEELPDSRGAPSQLGDPLKQVVGVERR